MKYIIEFGKNLPIDSLSVDITRLTKSQKNKSLPNLTNCCGEVVKQKKFCGKCNEEQSGEFRHKQFKITKDSHEVIPTALLKEIKERLDSDRIQINSFVDINEVNDIYFTDLIFTLKQLKQKTEYVEIMEMLRNTKAVGIGEFTIRNRTYPVMLSEYRGTLLLRALHYEEEVQQPTQIDKVQTDSEMVEIMGKVIDKNKTTFSLKGYENVREVGETKLIQMCINGEKLPKTETTTTPKTKSRTEQLQKLKASLGVE